MAPMGRIAALLNQKGGVGKTTVALGLASAANHAGHRVLVVDLDPQASSTWVLGHDPHADSRATDGPENDGPEIGSTAVDASQPAANIVTSHWGPCVDVMTSSPSLQEHDAGSPLWLRTALRHVASDYDAVLIDCPPSLGNLTVSALTAAELAIIVVEPAALGLRGIGAVADIIDQVWDSHNQDLELAGVIVNKVPAISSEADRRYDELTRIVGKRAIWKPVVPNRVILPQAIAERRPIHSYGARSAEVSEVFDRLWAKLRRLTRA
jgi:chromosome partitioning protein